MKHIFTILATGMLFSLNVYAETPVDNRPRAFPTDLSEDSFRSHGLWFWAEEETERTSSQVEYIYGDDKTSPTRRSLTCVGKVGAKVAIYCVSTTYTRDAALMIMAFLSGYIAGESEQHFEDSIKKVQ